MKKYFFIINIFISIFASAQPGSIDPTFDSGTGVGNFIHSIAIQTNGKILIGTSSNVYNQIPIYGIARLNSNGSLDTTFNSSAVAISNGFTDSAVRDVKILNDGKILIAGEFNTVNGISTNCIARLNSNGTLDTTFNNPGTWGVNNGINHVLIQSDGKILIAGGFTLSNGALNLNNIALLNSNGTIDTSFNPGLGSNSTINSLSIQNDGKILIGGIFQSYNGVSLNRIARLNSDGSVDNTFNIGQGVNNYVFNVTCLSDSKILVGGMFTTFNGVNARYFIRLNSNGSLDTTFNTSTLTDSPVFSTLVQTDGKILVGGYFDNYNGVSRKKIARLNNDGTLDMTFNSSVGIEMGGVSAIAMQNDGRLLLGGDFSGFGGNFYLPQGIVRLQNDVNMASNQINRNSLTIYPNPANDHITIDCGNLANVAGWSIKIVNAIGQEVFTGAMNTPQYVVPLNSWSGQGLYFVKIYDASNNLVNTKKIILQ